MQHIEVAAAIFRRNGRIFLCRRGEGGPCAFLWEFPGGKLEPGESPEACLARECTEELGVDIAIDGLYEQFDYEYPGKAIHFYFYNARILSGEPRLQVHPEARWLWPRELLSLTPCPADQELMARLAGELPFTHYLWDFDGTLFDTYPRIAGAMQAAFADFNHAVSYEESYALVKRSITHAAAVLLSRFGMDVPQREIMARYHFHEQDAALPDASCPYPGIADLLADIIRRGGKNHLYTHRGQSALKYLRDFHMDGLFEGVVTGDDPFPPKPAPDAILWLMKQYGMEAGRTVMVGDRDIDVLAGQNAGTAGCLFDPDRYYTDFAVELNSASVAELKKLLLGE